MSWGANTVAQFEENLQKASNLLGTLGNPEYEAFLQNTFKPVRWASGVFQRHEFYNHFCPCDSRMSMGDKSFRKSTYLVTIQ